MRRFTFAFALLAVLSAPLRAQFAHPIPVLERRMRDDSLVVESVRGSRMVVDRTQRVTLDYPDSLGGPMQIKWAKAPRDGADFNNEPRYEIAAYELQKLFLDEADYVVPPTVGRAVPLEWFRQYDEMAPATFRGVNSVVLAVQYWMQGMTPEGYWNKDRFEADSVYARHLGDFNILTYLIRHSDSNAGNFLATPQDAANPRVFTVDNGVAFRSPVSDRGYEWRSLRIERLPHATVERLRKITEADLQQALGIVLQFDVRDGQLVAAPRTTNIQANRGVRRTDELVQFGLTSAEIRDVYNRLTDLLADVDSGKIKVF